ncbi:MAG: hypothetical protein JNK65_04495, partial [Deltaproteobacteria bacterium]|nr:hypothetical protein [Deltaproteobacteria bacterium]
TSLLDTRPLKEFLSQKIPWKQIDSNIQSGFLEALSITATNTRTGNSELFIQKKQDLRYTGDYRYYDVQMSAEHVMASAAIPIVFPTVKVGKFYYTDGGIRLYTPMSPAIQLGADRILIVGLRHAPSEDEVKKVEAKEMRRPPLLTEVLGRVMNGLFLDRVRYDLEQLDRINKLIEWSEEVYGKEYLKKLNETIFKLNESKDIAARGLKKIQAVQILPTEFISDIFQRWFNRKNKKDFKFAPMEKLLTRLLEVDAEGSVELLSYLIFAQEYIEELIDLGYEDAKKNKDKIIEVMEGK